MSFPIPLGDHVIPDEYEKYSSFSAVDFVSQYRAFGKCLTSNLFHTVTDETPPPPLVAELGRQCDPPCSQDGVRLRLATNRTPYIEISGRKSEQRAKLRITKWHSMLDEWARYYGSERCAEETTRTGVWAPSTSQARKLSSRVDKGVPDSMRRAVWQRMLNTETLLQFHEPGWPFQHDSNRSTYYRSLAASFTSEQLDSISNAVRLVSSRHQSLNDRLIRLELARLLAALVGYHTELDLLPWIAPLAFAFLDHMPEVEAFWSINALLTRGIGGDFGSYAVCYCPRSPGIGLRCSVLHQLLMHGGGSRSRSWGWEALAGQGGPLHGQEAVRTLAQQALLTLFCWELPYPLALRFLDRFMLHGDTALLAALLAIVEREETGPVCSNAAQLRRALARGVLPSLKSAAYTDLPDAAIARIRCSTGAVELEDGIDFLDRAATIRCRLSHQTIQQLAFQWRCSVGRDALSGSRDAAVERVAEATALARSAGENTRCQARARAFLSITRVWDVGDVSDSPTELATALASDTTQAFESIPSAVPDADFGADQQSRCEPEAVEPPIEEETSSSSDFATCSIVPPLESDDAFFPQSPETDRDTGNVALADLFLTAAAAPMTPSDSPTLVLPIPNIDPGILALSVDHGDDGLDSDNLFIDSSGEQL